MTLPPKILAVGEVLWDLLPAGKQLGGAPGNFAFQCRELKADASLVTRVGDDGPGREILDRFQALALPARGVQIDPAAPTGTVSVSLGPGGQPSYTIHEGVAWDRIEADSTALELAAAAEAVCFGSLAQRAAPSRRAIAALLDATRPEALRVFDVNLRPPYIEPEVIAGSLERASVLKLNDEELPRLAQQFGLPTDRPRAAIEGLARRFGLRMIALTRGGHGSLLWTPEHWSEHAGRPVAIVDTVGAGDAFTATLVVGWLAGRTLDEINAHANAVAAHVCTQPGGTPPLPDELRRLAGWPEPRPGA